MHNWVKTFKILAYLACLGVAVLCMTALAGLAYGIPELRQWFSEGPPMRANTAIGLLCGALGFILRTYPWPRPLRGLLNGSGGLLSLIPLFIGVVTLVHYGLSLQSGFDTLIFQDPLVTGAYPGRPSPETALNLFVLGNALLLMNRPSVWSQRITKALALFLLGLPLITLISSFFGASNLYTILPQTQHAVGTATNTAVAMVLLSFALFFRRPDEGMAAIFVSPTMGGLIARRQLMTLIVLPFLVVILVQIEYLFGKNDRPVSQALALILAFGSLVAFNWFTARRLDRMDRQKQRDEQRLREQERLLAGVLDTVPVGIWITDITGHIVRGNQAGIKIWGGERYVDIPEYGQYKGWWVHNGQRIEAHDWALARALQKGETSVDETIKIETFDGAHKVILNSAMPLRNDQGHITGALVTNYDISRRFRLEQHQALVAHAGEELLTLRDLDTTFSHLAQLTMKSLCDCSMIFLLDDENRPKLVSQAHRETPRAQKMAAMLKRYEPKSAATMGIMGVIERGRSILVKNVKENTIDDLSQDTQNAADLREVLQSYMIVPMTVERKVIGAIGFASCEPGHVLDDIDLAAAEELCRLSALAIENARYAERLKQAIQAREDVVAIVSHDLRSPLSVILQSCDLMVSRLESSPETSASLLKLAHLARSAGKRMYELISDLLDLAHLESGHFVLKNEEFECVGFIQEIVELLTPIALQKKVRLTAALPAELPSLYADRTRFTQILNNLITNALKHTPAGGLVDVGAYVRDDGWLEVTVNDNGSGIKKEYLPLLFERYWKPHESEGGFGLGLFVVKGIVEAHGGRIEVTSEENKGTSFAFTLPTILVVTGYGHSSVSDGHEGYHKEYSAAPPHEFV
ncbi:MAG TPA: ATP-binding protein [Oligoflexus sp.]|uniref:sensor histidine kinase n=1 Tax=Oligoflexus sp. TaxID=1971216 RepID=UPI002D41C3EC|nr:ATP-binding protein [Oligoflexus sp.]HYX31670.1 ATP-binding protein [Oligoflexus sp.]